MHYYEVYPADISYKASGPLTYSSDKLMKVGQLAVVPIRTKLTHAIVIAKVPEPAFKTKPVSQILDFYLPEPLWQTLGWMSDFYAAPLAVCLSLALPRFSTIKHREVIQNGPIKEGSSAGVPVMTANQSDAVHKIRHSQGLSSILHGDTGSGKTRIYMELALQTVHQFSKSVLLLTPEIGLTPQLVLEFSTVFGDQVVVNHSRLTPSQRNRNWLKVMNSKEPLVVIGPRSTLFMPINNLGLVVVDEFHEPAYKQEQSPRYHGVRVASVLAAKHGARLVMGSATPSVHDYYLAEQKNIPIVRLKGPAKEVSAVSLAVVDMRDHAAHSQHTGLSKTMIEAIKESLNNGLQSLIFLNRRGSARAIICSNCGWQSTCPKCDSPLTYHADGHRMQCHVCGFHSKAPNKCPSCGSTDLIYRSIGTKAVTASLQKLFPSAKIGRYDSDNTADEQLSRNYDDISSGKIDILVGTQMLAKGLDLPKLSMLGVINSDSGLLFPDYTSEERTFQLLYQLLGRIGRGHVAGKAVVQTYQPESELLSQALARDWQAFYDNQLKERQTYRFPPYVFLLKIEAIGARQDSVKRQLLQLREELLKTYPRLDISDPAPSYMEKQANKYHWQLIVKSTNRKLLAKIAGDLPPRLRFDLDPLQLL